MQERITHELVERHHHRNRIAGQSEKMRVADFAVSQRPARFHRDLPEQHFAELVEDLLDVIGFAHGNAAAGDDHVGGLRGFVEGRFDLVRVVADHAHVEHFAAQPSEHAVDSV